MDDPQKDSKTVAVCLVKDDKGRYLFIKPSNYKDFGEFQDAWYPPTGHVKNGESVEECLVRELKEELNLDIKPVKLLSEWEQDIKGETAYWWDCKIIGGEIKPNYEISEYKWFTAEEIKRLKVWPATEKFFKKFIWKELDTPQE
jgi:8-oxo-dGTP diphosphatase